MKGKALAELIKLVCCSHWGPIGRSSTPSTLNNGELFRCSSQGGAKENEQVGRLDEQEKWRAADVTEQRQTNPGISAHCSSLGYFLR